MATAKPPTTAPSPTHDNHNKLDSGSYHWGAFVPSSPKMRQLRAERELKIAQEAERLSAAKDSSNG